MRISDTRLATYMQPVGLASALAVGRATPSLGGARPVLQASHRC
jgi:hypothetical protein